MSESNPRQVVFNALYDVILKDAYTEVAIDRAFQSSSLTTKLWICQIISLWHCPPPASPMIPLKD